MAAIGYLYFTLKFKKEETKTVEKYLRNQINKLGNEIIILATFVKSV